MGSRGLRGTQYTADLEVGRRSQRRPVLAFWRGGWERSQMWVLAQSLVPGPPKRPIFRWTFPEVAEWGPGGGGSRLIAPRDSQQLRTLLSLCDHHFTSITRQAPVASVGFV
jgi:hypothetical protein